MPGWFQAIAAKVAPPRRPGALLWGAAAVLTALGVLGNMAQLTVTFSVDFIFGSVFTLLAAALAGPLAGLGAALVASSYTWVLWGHPYAILTFSAEALWVGLALRRGGSSILLASSLFWLVLGMPMTALLYGRMLGQDLSGTTIILLKQALNGVFNALMADLLLALLPLERWLKGAREPRRLTLNHILFHTMVLFLLLPTLLLIRVTNQREARRILEMQAVTLRTDARKSREIIGNWVADYVRAAQAIADLGRLHSLRPSPALQTDMAQIQAMFTDFHAIYLADAEGRTVAFIPTINERGERTIGQRFADRPYFQELHRTGKPVVSDVFPGRGGTFQPIFTISAPLMEGGVLRGYGLGAANLERLKARLAPPVDSRLALTILDGNGRILVSTLEGRQPLAPLDAPAPARVEAVAGEVYMNIPANVRNKSVMDIWKTAYLWNRHAVPGTNWTLLAEYPMAPIRDHFYQSTIRNLALIGVWYLVALGLASLASRALTHLPAGLAAFSRDLPGKVEAGEVIAWPESRIQEVALVIDNFRAVTDALALRIQEVNREAARNLEQERALIHQARLASMGEMIGNIAHQWRQPLNALAMQLSNLKDAGRFHELTEDYLNTHLDRSQDLIQKMSATISDFATFFRPSKQPVAFSLRRQTEEAIALVGVSQDWQGMAVLMEGDEAVQAMGHPSEFSQVLLNLLANARDAILASGRSGGHIQVRIAAEGGRATLRFSDDGGGIRVAPITRIFEPYFTDKPSGTGLGLYMSRMILEQSMAGTIEARNIPGGAEFIITLALAG